MVTVYDTQFNLNEFFILAALLSGVILFITTKKIFSTRETIAFLLLPVFLGVLLDHTISIPPFDFYDVNDSSKFELMDFLTYLMYGPYGYFFLYCYKRMNIKMPHVPAYILAWALVSIAFEYAAHHVGVYHYKNGYQIYYSFPIYLLVLSGEIFFYKLIQSQRGCKDNPPPSHIAMKGKGAR